MQIVNTQQNASKHLILLYQVTNIRTTMRLTCWTGAVFIKRTKIMNETRIAHIHASLRRKRSTHTCSTSWQYAVKHIHPFVHRTHQGSWVANPHHITRLILGAGTRNIAERFKHHFVIFAYWITSDTKAFEVFVTTSHAFVADFLQTTNRFKTHIKIHAALTDGEQCLIFTCMRSQTTLCPSRRKINRTLDKFTCRRIRRTLIELHNYVGAQFLLNVHIGLWSPANLAAIIDRRKRYAIIVEL